MNFKNGFMLLYFFSQISVAQELNKIIKEDCNGSISELYYVQKKQPKIKEGLYKKFYCRNKKNIPKQELDTTLSLNADIFSDKNLINKKGTTQSQFYVLNMIQEEGEYKENVKVGVWKKSKKIQNAYIIEKFDHTKNMALEPEIFIEMSYPILAAEREIEGVVYTNLTYKMVQTIL